MLQHVSYTYIGLLHMATVHRLSCHYNASHPDLNLCTTSGIEPSIDHDISITQNIQIHFRYISTSGFFKSMQIPHLHFLLLYYTVIHRYWPTHVEIPIIHSVIWYLGYTYSNRFKTFTIG